MGKLADRRPGCAERAGKSAHNRLDHAPRVRRRYHKIGHDGAAIERLLIDLLIEAWMPPKSPWMGSKAARSNIDASAGALEIDASADIGAQLHRHWPTVRISCGRTRFARERLMA